MRSAGAILAFALLACGCGGPLGPFAGGRLSGAIGPTQMPEWPVDSETLQLETRPADPYSINVWFASVGPRLYVPSSMILGPKRPDERSWVAHVTRDPAVRLRLDGILYDRIARRVTDGAEYDEALAALERKYEISEGQRDPEREVWIFRMDPRVPSDGGT